MKPIGDPQSSRGFDELVSQLAGAGDGQMHLRKIGDQLDEELLVLLGYQTTDSADHNSVEGQRAAGPLPWEDIHSFLSSLDLFVFPSHFEGFRP